MRDREEAHMQTGEVDTTEASLMDNRLTWRTATALGRTLIALHSEEQAGFLIPAPVEVAEVVPSL